MSSPLGTSPADEALYSSNTERSPLLRLPSELRERIWQYTLGGKVLHIGRKGQFPYGTAYAYECKAVDDERRMLDNGGPGANTVPRPTPPFFARHSHCETSHALNWGLHLPVHLLRTCRLIYQDASLLPFTENTFLFTDIHPHAALICFLRGLKPEQTRAIQRMIVMCSRSNSGPQEPAEPNFIAKSLTGLRDLTYTVEYNDYETALCFSEDLRRERKRLAADVLVFEGLALKVVHVSVGLCYTRRVLAGLSHGASDLVKLSGVAREWEAGVVKQLMEEAKT
ncbi:hypothetical protein B0A55_10344 [Friedmanniomyces simplex]|uniref:DUF7730 domain-containing protein n=1 Tax=Friedmanniomyces simplex TaxID=329884 RepID=A0A4U0WMD2_9PEZI|nr:hypothetical protein B0A55_10344 [Friedmanniomyces simplex]